MNAPAAREFTADDLRALYLANVHHLGANVPVVVLLDAAGINPPAFQAAVAELDRRYRADHQPERLDHFTYRGVDLFALRY